jgi:poly(A) polymerase
VDCLGSHGDLEYYNFAMEKLGELRGAEDEEAKLPAPFITGHDLIGAGMRPGPEFKEVLQATHDAQLEGRVHNPAEALNFARELAKSRGYLE